METRQDLARALEALAERVRYGEDLLDLSEELRGLAYDAENIYD